MMEFIMLTISFTMAILLASGLSVYIVLQPKVVKWYMKHIVKYMKEIEKTLEDFEEEL